MFSLDGKRAVVTGGASGMGAAIVEGYAGCGVRVAIVDQNAKLGRQVAERIGRNSVSFLECDITDSQAVDLTVEAALRTLKRIDILVNAAGVFLTGPAEDLSDTEWESAEGQPVRHLLHEPRRRTHHDRPEGGQDH
jgi:NAD(P)-dependent dehydrogenase (short-subunit alcohol dehydrogenase family)